MTEHVAEPAPTGTAREPVSLERVDREPEPSASGRHRLAATIAVVAFVAIVVATVGVAMSSRTHGPAKVDDRRHHSTDPRLRLGRGAAQVKVLSALSATTGAGSFDVSYLLSGTEATSPTTTSTLCQQLPNGTAKFGPAVIGPISSSRGTTSASVVTSGRSTTVCETVGSQQPVTVTGQGTINVNPKAMVVSASISNGLDVSVRLDDQNVWESGGADYGTAPNGSASGSGQPLSGFAGLTESTIGNREGAIGMLGMASPSGYLDLESESVTGAAADGSGVVDGVPVTYYRVAVDPSKLVDVPGMSADEIATVNAAVGVLHQEGYTGTEARVALDAGGYIRQVTSVATFGDGGTVTLASTFSNFGCAGTVTMPGQPVAPPPPPNCTSPVSSTTTTLAPGTSTTEPAVSTTSTPTTSTTTPEVSTTSVPPATDPASTTSTTS